MVMSEAVRIMPIKHFSRETIAPPSRAYPRLDYAASLDAVDMAVKRKTMSTGRAGLLTGLLEHGGVAQFPGGLGLAYDRVFKYTFDTRSAKPALQEMADTVRDSTDIIIAPEHSAIIPAAQLGYELDVPVLKVRKNGSSGTLHSPFAVSLDSYTSDRADILSVDETSAQDLISLLPRNGKYLQARIVDEILDTGAMTEAIAYLLSLMKQSGIPVELRGAIALMEKEYTGARQKIQEQLYIDVVSGLTVQDIGNDGQTGMWIKIPGINEALSFSS